tara:strand:- start:10409 stop:10774 length:366 start_codon:yes stop_codon:yes gene_type:complete
MAVRRRNFNAPNKSTGACSTFFGGCAGTGTKASCAKKCKGQAEVRRRAFRGQAGTRLGGQARGRVTGEPTTFQRRLKGGQFTGQPVNWKNAGGEIFGLTTQQALISVGVGILAYFIVQRVK